MLFCCHKCGDNGVLKNMRKTFLLFYCAVFSVIFATSPGIVDVRGQSDKKVPRIEDAPCRVPIPDGVKGVCYDLIVPESRKRQTARTVRLPIVIIKSTSPTPQSDPVIYTAGGPGAGSLGRVRNAGNLVPYTNSRDFIVFEQRGTQHSEPSLQCPEVTEALRNSRRMMLSPEKSARAEVDAAKQCRQRLANLGIDFGAYNSAEIAADMDDLRMLLGIKKWNLYGISYSTRLMLNYVRAFPSAVRSIILDSVLPPTVNWDETGVDHVMGSLALVFEECSADADCAAKYPSLEEKFYAAAEYLDRSPPTVDAKDGDKITKVKLIGRDFVDLIYNLLEGSNSLTYIPSTIDSISKKNYEPLKLYAEDQLKSGGFIWGMRYSVWCTEEMPFQNRTKIAAGIKKHPRLRGFSIQGAFPEICKVWKVPSADGIENEKVTADVPVLVFSGRFDPDTPPAWGKTVASWFKNGYFFEAKTSSHGVMNNRCTFAEIPIAFLADPYTRPDGKCLDAAESVKFK